MQTISSTSINYESKVTSVKYRVSITLFSILMILPFFKQYASNETLYLGKQSALVLFILFYLYKKSKEINQSKMIALFAVTFVACALSMFNSPSPKSAALNALMYSIVIIAVFLFPKIKFREFKIIITIFLLSIFALVTLPSLLGTNDLFFYSHYGGRTRFVGTLINANTLGRLCLLGFLLSVRLWGHWKGKFKKSFLLFMMIANVYLIYLADSRGSLAVVVLVILFALIFKIYSSVPKKLFVSFVVFSLTIPLILYLYVINSSMIEIDLNQLTTGRTSIWKNMFIGLDWKGLLVGVGNTGLDIGSHNGYLEILRYFGLVGTLIWVPLILYLVLKKWKFSKRGSDFVGFGIVAAFLLYYLIEGSMVSLANLASIYFWMELLQTNKDDSPSEQTAN